MRKPRFKLQAVLDLRLRAERERAGELAKANAASVAIEGSLRILNEAIDDERSAMRASLIGAAVDVRGARFQAACQVRLQVRAEQAARDLVDAYRQVTEARGRLARATSDRRALELLRARADDAWRTRIDREEAAALDDLSARVENIGEWR